MIRNREQVARSAASKLSQAAPALATLPVLVGFDGFIDSIIRVVDRRESMAPEDYSPFATIGDFAKRVAAAAGKSTGIELVRTEDRFGGNGPLMAGALGSAGLHVTYIGALGTAESPLKLHPIYEPFAQRCRDVISVGPSAATDALEFDDGKIMLCKPANIQSVDWESLKANVGRDRLFEIVGRARLISIVNWVQMRGVESIWDGLCDELFPALGEDARNKRIFLDLADPAKRLDSDVSRALGKIQRLDSFVPATLGLNLAEAQRIASVMGLRILSCQSGPRLGESVREGAEAMRRGLGIDCVVIHPREGAAASDSSGASRWFDGPFTDQPRLSTGAGDHFNAGFALGRLLALDLDESLALGCAASGAYVRDAQSPSARRLVAFLNDLPPPRA